MNFDSSSVNNPKEVSVLLDWKDDLDANVSALAKLISKQQTKRYFPNKTGKIMLSKNDTQVFPLRKMLGVAASMVVILCAVVVLQLANSFEAGMYETQISKQTVNLIDGTEVVLDRKSSLQTLDKRSVSFDGRGYFKVESSPSNPFNIQTKYGLVQVLGTEFSLDVTGDHLELYVTEGVVKYGANGDSQMVFEGGFLNVTGSDYDSTKSVPANYLSWYDGKLEFRNASIEDVISSLNSHFDLSLTLNDVTSNKDIKFNSRYTNPKLEEIIFDLKTIGCTINEKSL